MVLTAGLCACGASSVPPPREPLRPTSVTLTILSTHDLHGQLEPLNLYTPEQPPRRFRVGGAEALAATISELRARDPEGTLLLDAGDFMQGTLLSNTFEGAPVRDLFSILGYSAVAIGNHEFDFGPRGEADEGTDLRGALKAWIRDAPFKVLAANILDARGSPLAWPNLQASTVVVRKGVRVGVIGLITPSTYRTTMPKLVRDLTFLPSLPTVQRQARSLRALGVDVVILLAHEGGQCDSRRGGSCRGPLFGKLLHRLEPGLVDAVVAGHTHQCIWHRINSMLVSQACSKGMAVGQMHLVFDRSTRKIDSSASRVLPPVAVCHDLFSDSHDCEGLRREGAPRGQIIESPLLAKHRSTVLKIREVMQGYTRRLGIRGSQVLAKAVRPIRHQLSGVSELGTLFANALRDAVPGADVALINSAALRADLPRGEIRLAQLVASFPFKNRLATAVLSGQQLERLVSSMIARAHGIVQVSGLQLRIRCGRSKKLISITTPDRKPLDPGKLYTVVVNDFLLTGGSGAGPVLESLPPQRKRIYNQRTIRHEVANYLLSLDHPLNSVQRPVFLPENPPIIMENGPCDPSRNRPRFLCR